MTAPRAPANRAEVLALVSDAIEQWRGLSPVHISGATLAALEAAGVRLVPVEATEEMRAAGWIDKEDVSPAEIFRAMCDVSPYAPEDEHE